MKESAIIADIEEKMKDVAVPAQICETASLQVTSSMDMLRRQVLLLMDSRKSDGIDLTILGDRNPAYGLFPKDHLTHGMYNEERIGRLVRVKYKKDDWEIKVISEPGSIGYLRETNQWFAAYQAIPLIVRALSLYAKARTLELAKKYIRENHLDFIKEIGSVKAQRFTVEHLVNLFGQACCGWSKYTPGWWVEVAEYDDIFNDVMK